jgi:hypothetical protein
MSIYERPGWSHSSPIINPAQPILENPTMEEIITEELATEESAVEESTGEVI